MGTMDYGKYRCNLQERFRCVLVGLAGAGLISWLLYRSWYAMSLALPVYLLYKRSYEKEAIRKRREKLLLEFKDGMQAASAALLAGYSMENAWREAERELGELHGEASLLYGEVHQMNAAVRMNEPLEKVLMDFARRSGCEEIESFAEVFSFAKRSGGDFPGIMQATVKKLSGKLEVEREISTAVAGKKLEGKIMNAMPVFILVYLNLTSGDFLDALYGNLLGCLVMTAVLTVYVAALALSGKILDIQV